MPSMKTAQMKTAHASPRSTSSNHDGPPVARSVGMIGCRVSAKMMGLPCFDQ
jgi:hypothetical protein